MSGAPRETPADFLGHLLPMLAVNLAALSANYFTVWGVDAETGCKFGFVVECETDIISAITWSGPMVNGKAQGMGAFRLTIINGANKIAVEGEAEMKAGLIDGVVKLKSSTGYIYTGNYSAGQRQGKGVMQFADGTIYGGEWKDGKEHGWGVKTYPSGDRYEGQYCKGVANGKGRKFFTDKALYYGEWKDGVFHGKGLYKWPDGRSYEGEFKHGRMHGYGALRDEIGKVQYEGEWLYGERA
jgi:hypothetical protein